MERDITYSESALFKFISMESFVQWWFIFQSEDNQKIQFTVARGIIILS